MISLDLGYIMSWQGVLHDEMGNQIFPNKTLTHGAHEDRGPRIQSSLKHPTPKLSFQHINSGGHFDQSNVERISG